MPTEGGPRTGAGRRRRTTQSKGDEKEIARRLGAGGGAAGAGTAASRETDDHTRVAKPGGGRRGETAPLGGPEAAEVGGPALRGETELPFSGWPAQPEAAAETEEGLLDAWHASYSSSVTIARLKRVATGAEAVPEVILPGGDDRQQVPNTTDFPWRCICHLVITAADGSRWVGTGWLAGPRTVLTAGHCVYTHGVVRGWARSISVYPGRNGSQMPYQFTATDLRSVKGWTERQGRECDYGAILLPERAVVGYFGYQSMTDQDLSGLLANVYGYPGDKATGTLWGNVRQLQQVLPNVLVYNISTYGGQSGCPVFYKHEQDREVVGIHNYGDLSGNSATRITAPVFDNIGAWKAEAP